MAFYLASLPKVDVWDCPPNFQDVREQPNARERNRSSQYKPDCADANFRELCNLDSHTVSALLEEVESEELSLN
jgi:hypothetical protein